MSPPKGKNQKKDKKADKPQQNGFAEKTKAVSNLRHTSQDSQLQRFRKINFLIFSEQGKRTETNSRRKNQESPPR